MINYLFYSSAHKNISDAIEAANKAAKEATNQVNDAHYTLYPEQSISVIDRAQSSLLKSQQLKDNAREKIDNTEGKIAFLLDCN